MRQSLQMAFKAGAVNHFLLSLEDINVQNALQTKTKLACYEMPYKNSKFS
jgi:hypothetical protein